MTKAGSGKGKKKTSGVNFEKDLEKLEVIVDSLEEGGLSLDDSLKKFEEGITLAKRCEKALGAAEKKIELLTRGSGGELQTESFGDEDEENGDDDAPAASSAEADSEDDDGELLF